MNGNAALAAKPLPPPAKDEKLPSIPPLASEDSWNSIPSTPPKIISQDRLEGERMPARPIRTIDTSSSLNSLDAGERIVCFSPLDSLANWEQPRRIWLDPSLSF